MIAPIFRFTCPHKRPMSVLITEDSDFEMGVHPCGSSPRGNVNPFGV